MVAQPFTVDLNKPLVFQVGHLGEAYQEWVHQPIVSKEGPRFFESDFFEFLTRTVWWVIPLIWLPVVCWSVLMSIQMGHTLPEVALLVVTGVFIWTLMEYSLHRFLFHIKTKGYWTNTAHYLLHGCHHKHPMDGLRLVFPPAATAILCVPFGSLLRLTTSFGGNSHLQQTISMVIYFFAINNLKERLNIYHFEGGLLGYVMYDVTHYYLHHGQPSGEVTRNLKRYHLNHHFRIQNRGFGITSSLWDNVFGTHPSSKAADKNR